MSYIAVYSLLKGYSMADTARVFVLDFYQFDTIIILNSQGFYNSK